MSSKARARSNWSITAIDSSYQALNCCFFNKYKYSLDNVNVLYSNWFEQIDDKLNFDIIFSNPPYIDIEDDKVSTSVRTFEPHSALFAQDRGFEHYNHICSIAGKYLAKGGLLILEHGFQQRDCIAEILIKNDFMVISYLKDLQGLSRGVVAQFKAKASFK